MWAYIFRKLLYNVPVYLTILLLVMAMLRVNDPVYGYLGKNATQEQYLKMKQEMGLDRPFWLQYGDFLWRLARLDFSENSWNYPGQSVGTRLVKAVPPSLSLTVPALILSAAISICVGIVSAYFRGRPIDRALVVAAVVGMSVSYLVYIILGQYFGAYWINRQLGQEVFAISGYRPGVIHWPTYLLLPVMISVIVSMGYDTRFYRAVMVEESSRDYITTAKAKGASKPKVMFVHMLKNAMIPIVTRIAITLPFLITGSILMENFFGIPGMGRELITAVNAKDFPIIQAFTAVFAAFYIATIVLTDVVYALVDPRVRLA